MPGIREGRLKGVRVRLFALYYVSAIYCFTLALTSSSSLLLLLQVFAPFVSSSSSSSSSSTVNRNTYNVYNYDQTTPQFTPDGRLLQVEYASSAADLSPPLVVFECVSPTTNSNSDNDNDSDNSLSYPCTVLITVPKQSHSPQNRIVIIEKKDYDEHRSYCVAMSGILADSLALLQAGMKVAAQHSLQYRTFFGMESLTQTLADECQSRVFAGGLRPYGSTLLLCGYKHHDYNDEGNSGYKNITNYGNRNYQGKLFQSLIYQTDPSGGILQHHIRPVSGEDKRQQKQRHSRSAASNSSSKNKKRLLMRRQDIAHNNINVLKTEVRCIVGGLPSLRRQLRKRIDQGLMKFEHNLQQQHRNCLGSSLAERIACVAKILIQETIQSDSSTKNKSKSQHFKEDGSSLSSSSNSPLEIVVISPRLGCHRLDDEQLRAIRELVHDGN